MRYVKFDDHVTWLSMSCKIVKFPSSFLSESIIVVGNLIATHQPMFRSSFLCSWWLSAARYLARRSRNICHNLQHTFGADLIPHDERHGRRTCSTHIHTTHIRSNSIEQKIYAVVCMEKFLRWHYRLWWKNIIWTTIYIICIKKKCIWADVCHQTHRRKHPNNHKLRCHNLSSLSFKLSVRQSRKGSTSSASRKKQNQHLKSANLNYKRRKGVNARTSLKNASLCGPGDVLLLLYVCRYERCSLMEKFNGRKVAKVEQ